MEPENMNNGNNVWTYNTPSSTGGSPWEIKNSSGTGGDIIGVGTYPTPIYTISTNYYEKAIDTVINKISDNIDTKKDIIKLSKAIQKSEDLKETLLSTLDIEDVKRYFNLYSEDEILLKRL